MHAIGGRTRADRVQLDHLRWRGRHDEFAATPVRHIACLAIGVQHGLAFHAQLRLERARGIVNTGVDDFAVARAGLGANGIASFEHQHLAPSQGQLTGHGQPDDAGTDHYTIDTVCLLRHCRSSPSPATVSFLPGGTVR